MLPPVATTFGGAPYGYGGRRVPGAPEQRQRPNALLDGRAAPGARRPPSAAPTTRDRLAGDKRLSKTVVQQRPLPMLPTEDLFVHVYVLIDDAISARAITVAARPGPAPGCTDAELLAIAVVRHLLGRRSEAGFLAEVARDWAHLFPRLPGNLRRDHRPDGTSPPRSPHLLGPAGPHRSNHCCPRPAARTSR
jgi:hypothetical protein